MGFGRIPSSSQVHGVRIGWLGTPMRRGNLKANPAIVESETVNGHSGLDR